MYSMKKNIIYTIRHGYANRKELLFTAPLEILCSVLLPVFGILLPGVFVYLIEKGSSLDEILLYMGLFILVVGSLRLLQALLFQRNAGLEIDVRMLFAKMLAKKTLFTSYLNIEQSDARSEIQRALTYAIESNAYGFEGIIREGIVLLTNIFGLCIYSLLLADIHPFIVIVMLGLSIVQIKVYTKAIAYREEKKEEIVPTHQKVNYLKKECVDLEHAKDIRLYHMQPWILTIFEGLKETLVGWEGRIAKKFFHSDMKKNGLTFLRDGIAYSWLLYEVFNGLSIASFIVCVQAVNGFSTWLEMIVNAYTHMKIDNHGINDYRTYMERDDTLGSSKKVSTTSNSTIRFEHVSFAYPQSDREVLSDFHTIIEVGEKIALVGINGAGKTTLVKLLCGLYKPTKGTIYIDDIDIQQYPKHQLWSRLSVVFQDVNLFAFTIAENVACVPKEQIDYKRVETCLKEAGLMDKVNTLKQGLESPMLKILDDEGVLLSGGEKQKLMLAKALYHAGDILILDEPTAALDPLAESELYEQYDNLTKGHTSIFVSHRLSSTRFCDRILYLENGQIIEAGNHEQLMQKQGQYAHMYTIQSRYYQKGGMDDVQ